VSLRDDAVEQAPRQMAVSQRVTCAVRSLCIPICSFVVRFAAFAQPPPNQPTEVLTGLPGTEAASVPCPVIRSKQGKGVKGNAVKVREESETPEGESCNRRYIRRGAFTTQIFAEGSQGQGQSGSGTNQTPAQQPPRRGAQPRITRSVLVFIS
jgi:hypothetical protein